MSESDHANNRGVGETIRGIIDKLSTRSGSGKKPWQAIEMLETFESADSNGVAVDNLAPFFNDVPDKARRIASVVANLNARYLEEEGLQIVGEVHYKIIKKD